MSDDFWTASAMARSDSRFNRALAQAWNFADGNSRATIQREWRQIWDEFAPLGQQLKAADAALELSIAEEYESLSEDNAIEDLSE